MKIATLSSLSEFVDRVEQVGDAFTDENGYAAPWFRGMGSSDFKLIPGIYRTDTGREPNSDDEVRFEFARRALVAEALCAAGGLQPERNFLQ